jgi:glucokinase
LPVALEHDAKAAALGEYHFGAGREHHASDLVYVIVGTGVGAAFIVDGELYRGKHNSAGEIGHITIHRQGEPGSSGVLGCVESYLSGPCLVKQYARLMRDPVNELTAQEIVQRATNGEVAAITVMTDAGDALGAAVATTAMLMDMDLFVIGGSVAKAGDVLLEPARKAVWKYAFQSVASRIKIVATKLHEDGAILGCAWQARQLI